MNGFFNFLSANFFPKGQLARSGSVNDRFTEVAQGFDKLPTEDDLKRETVNYVAAGGTANAITATLTYAPTAYTDGMKVRLAVATTNTSTTVTLNCNGLGDISVKRMGGASPGVGDLRAGDTVDMIYDGGSFYMATVTEPRMEAAETSISSLVAGSGVLVSSNDTTTGFLNGKLVAGNGISFTENNDGGNETLTISPATDLIVKTADYAVDAADLYGMRTLANTGASGAVNFTLPAGQDGMGFGFMITAAQTMTFTANGTEKFQIGETLGSAGGTIDNNLVGVSGRFAWNGSAWQLTSLVGWINYS